MGVKEPASGITLKREPDSFFKEVRMAKMYVRKDCEIYLPGSAYREDMVSLPLDCFLDEEEYKALPEDKKQDYCLLVDGKCQCQA